RHPQRGSPCHEPENRCCWAYAGYFSGEDLKMRTSNVQRRSEEMQNANFERRSKEMQKTFFFLSSLRRSKFDVGRSTFAFIPHKLTRTMTLQDGHYCPACGYDQRG